MPSPQRLYTIGLRSRRAAGYLLIAFLSSIWPLARAAHSPEDLMRQIGQAQKRRELAAVERLSRQYAETMGTRAGVPDAETRFSAPGGASPLAPEEIRRAFTPLLERLQRDAWWTNRPRPAEMPAPLRNIASVVEGCLAAHRAGCDYPDRLLRVAREGADFLLWAQEQGGHGCFPFPAMRGRKGRTGELAERALTLAKANGRVEEVLNHGWFISDGGGGDLQFDNGVSGVAVLNCYRATRDTKYLRSAKAAADWALGQPVVRNWNYNSFSVFLLAEVYRVTGETKYLDSARQKAALGIYPGQLASGPNRGRWSDPHNARLVYHYILLRGLGALVASLPPDDPDLPRAREALVAGLTVRNNEVLQKGIASPETVLDTLSRLVLWKVTLPAETNTREAFERVANHTSALFRSQSPMIPPGAAGLTLEVLRQPAPPSTHSSSSNARNP